MIRIHITREREDAGRWRTVVKGLRSDSDAHFVAKLILKGLKELEVDVTIVSADPALGPTTVEYPALSHTGSITRHFPDRESAEAWARQVGVFNYAKITPTPKT